MKLKKLKFLWFLTLFSAFQIAANLVESTAVPISPENHTLGFSFFAGPKIAENAIEPHQFQRSAATVTEVADQDPTPNLLGFDFSATSAIDENLPDSPRQKLDLGLNFFSPAAVVQPNNIDNNANDDDDDDVIPPSPAVSRGVNQHPVL